MAKAIEILSIDETRAVLLQLLIQAQKTGDTGITRLVISVNEHLKDAQRWKHVENHEIPPGTGMTPRDIKRYVDLELEKLL